MANQIFMLVSELVLAASLMMFMFLMQRHITWPQYLDSVGWHGGKKRG